MNSEIEYGNIQRLIWSVCNEFLQKHGGEFEEHEAEANLVYVRAVDGWREGGAPFPNYLATCIYRQLLDKKRVMMRKRQVWKVSLESSMKNGECIQVDDYRQPYDWEWAEELSDDGRDALDMAVNPPEAVLLVAAQKGGEMRNLRSTIKEELAVRLGAKRARAAFEEVRSHL